MVHADGLPARITVLGKHAVEAGQTIWPPIPHDVSLSPELEIALETCKVLHVPRSPLGLGALVGENDLRDRLAILAVWMTPSHNGGPAHAHACLAFRQTVPGLFGREGTYLVAGGAPGFYGFCVVPPAEQFAVLVKVDEIHQELFAYGAGEAAGMPAVIGAQARGGHADISAVDRACTLKRKVNI